MPVTVWRGHLTFGLVSMPVRLFKAARAERMKFRQLYRPSTPGRSQQETVSGRDRVPEMQPSEVRPKHAYAEEPEPEAAAPVSPVKRVYEAPASAGEQP